MDVTPIPEGFEYLVARYFQVKRTADPITWSELNAWSSATKTPLTAWEAEAIIEMDNVILRSRNDG